MRAWIRMGAAVLIALAGSCLAGPALADYLVPEAGIRFPDRLGPFTLSKGQKHAETTGGHERGHQIEYRTRVPGADSLAGSVYVYDRGYTTIEDGIGGILVRAEFDRTCGEFVALVRTVGPAQPELLERRTMNAGGIEFLIATYRIGSKNSTKVSLVGMTGARRHFIKLRLSAERGAKGVEQINTFVAEVGRLLAASAGVIGAPPVDTASVGSAPPRTTESEPMPSLVGSRWR